MIIFNKDWLVNENIQEQVERARNLGEVTRDEFEQVKLRYPVGFYTPNLFIRIGLFLLTLVIAAFSGGLISLIMMDSRMLESPAYLFFLGIITYFALEFMVREKKHFRSGVDDALIWTSAGLILTGMLWSSDSILNAYGDLAVSGFVFLLATYYTLRFADVLMAITSILALVFLVFFGWQRTGIYPLQTMPFLIIILTAVLYLVSDRAREHPAFVYYKNCLQVASLVALLVCYAAGNYFVVREIGTELVEERLTPDSEIPLAWFFWAWTFIVPIAYIAWGIKRKDQLLLRSGMILVAVAAFTLRNYYHVMSAEALLSILGAGLLAFAYGVIRYLNTPKHGFTSAELSDSSMIDNIQIESLIVAETMSAPDLPDQGRLGGGAFGGGGASGDF